MTLDQLEERLYHEAQDHSSLDSKDQGKNIDAILERYHSEICALSKDELVLLAKEALRDRIQKGKARFRRHQPASNELTAAQRRLQQEKVRLRETRRAALRAVAEQQRRRYSENDLPCGDLASLTEAEFTTLLDEYRQAGEQRRKTIKHRRQRRGAVESMALRFTPEVLALWLDQRYDGAEEKGKELRFFTRKDTEAQRDRMKAKREGFDKRFQYFDFQLELMETEKVEVVSDLSHQAQEELYQKAIELGLRRPQPKPDKEGSAA